MIGNKLHGILDINKNKMYFYIKTLGFVSILFSHPVFAENALEKSLLEIKSVIQSQVRQSPNSTYLSGTLMAANQNSAADDVFGADVPKQSTDSEYLWKNKVEFLESVSRGGDVPVYRPT